MGGEYKSADAIYYHVLDTLAALLAGVGVAHAENPREEETPPFRPSSRTAARPAPLYLSIKKYKRMQNELSS